MSYMKQVAEMLELEWNDKEGRSEYFKYTLQKGKHYFTESCLMRVFAGETEKSKIQLNNVFDNEIYKLPKKPRWQQIKELRDEEFKGWMLNILSKLDCGANFCSRNNNGGFCGYSHGKCRDHMNSWLNEEGEL